LTILNLITMVESELTTTKDLVNIGFFFSFLQDHKRIFAAGECSAGRHFLTLHRVSRLFSFLTR